MPRASLSTATHRDELRKTGVYVLVGSDSENAGQRKIYIGEADTILTRLAAHNRDQEKDFWDEAVVFVCKDENLTKSHTRFLEARLISLALKGKRATVANGTFPVSQGMLPEAHEVEMEEFIAQARLLLGTLGYDIFEPAPSFRARTATQAVAAITNLPEFVCSGPGYSAICAVDVHSGQFIIKAGSTARKQDTPALQKTYRNLRSRLRENGVLREASDNSFEFSQDYSFSSPTAAAQVVSGTPVNGRTAWRTSDGIRTFADWQDEQLPSEAVN